MLSRVYGFVRRNTAYFLYHLSPKMSARFLYRLRFGRWPDLNNPRLFQEKLTLLKVGPYANDPKVIQCADKYRVREYIKSKGLEHQLNELYGVYPTVQSIDLSVLPNAFALKANNGSGDAILCDNKEELDLSVVAEKLDNNQKFYMYRAEPHYQKIKPCIVVEKLLTPKADVRPPDYKIYCLNGEPDHILVCYNRTSKSYQTAYYDCDWNFISNYCHSADKVAPPFKKPVSLPEMLESAKVLAEGFPLVRVDYYDIGGTAVFGEMTFTPASALDNYTDEAEEILGKKLDISAWI